MKLKPDKKLRDQFFTPESYSHPAKGHLGMWWEIMERYTKEGDWILDPMAGIGATLIGALMGRNIVCVELEQHFITPMLASWEKMRQKPMLGHEMGQVVILRGDARALPLGSVDGVITSPPYEQADQHRTSVKDRISYGQDGVSYERNTRPVDAVISSPPYQNREDGTQASGARGFHSYTEEPSVYWHTQRDQSNIGNLRGPAYWQAMTAVYSECHRVLKPQGIIVLVLKGFTREGKYVDLPALTQKCVEDLGFCHIDTWHRELWNLSFWRILQATEAEETVVAKTKGMFTLDLIEVKKMKRILNGKLDDRLRYEQVLAFRKDGDGGSGIEAVITSPPYEGITGDGKEIGSRGHTIGPFSYTRQEKP